MAATRPSIYSPSIWAFNGRPIIRCPSSCPNLAVYRNRHAGHFPRVSAFRLSQTTERTNRKRQPMRVVCSVKKLSEIEAIPLSEGPKLPSASGIYAVHDKKGELQFIGISRRIAASVLSHLQDVPDLCGTVKIAIVDEPDRTALTDAWKLWMEEHIEATGKVPPGNESGNTTWIRKQRRVKQDLRLTPGRHVKLTLSLEQLIDKLVKENEVVVFIKGSRTAPQCGFSHKVLTILNEQGVDYESVNVFDEEYNPGLREALKVYSKWPTFPQVFVRGELIGGADILTEMAEKGELRELLKK